MAIDGPCEALGVMIGGLAGMVVGLDVANDAIEFARHLDEVKDVFSYTVLEHPYLTYITSIIGGGIVGAAVGQTGSFADMLIGTYEPRDR